MDMKLIEKNVIECLISLEELDSRWNVTIEDIIGNSEKGRSVTDYIVSQSQRKYNLKASCLYEIQVQMRKKSVCFIIKSLEDKEFKSLENGESNYEELPYGYEDEETAENGMEKENADNLIAIDSSQDGVYPLSCYGYRFRTMQEVIHACSVLTPVECSSSLCKEKGKYILILSLNKNVGDAVQTILSEFTEDYFYYSKNCVPGWHEEVLQRYAEGGIIIPADAIGKLSNI